MSVAHSTKWRSAVSGDGLWKCGGPAAARSFNEQKLERNSCADIIDQFVEKTLCWLRTSDPTAVEQVLNAVGYRAAAAYPEILTSR